MPELMRFGDLSTKFAFCMTFSSSVKSEQDSRVDGRTDRQTAVCIDAPLYVCTVRRDK